MVRGAAVQNMLGRGSEEVAKFLAKTSGLEKAVIGEYLGEREETALAVMHAYVDAMDFAGLAFDEAIRHACCQSHPRLPPDIFRSGCSWQNLLLPLAQELDGMPAADVGQPVSPSDCRWSEDACVSTRRGVPEPRCCCS